MAALETSRRRLADRIGPALLGGALAVDLLLLLAFFALITVEGLAAFRVRDVEVFELKDGRRIAGSVLADERAGDGSLRLKIETGGRDLYGAGFAWLGADRIRARRRPPDIGRFERLAWGPVFGRLEGLVLDGRQVTGPPEALWARLQAALAAREAGGGLDRALVRTAGGRQLEIELPDLVRAFRPNRLGGLARLGLFARRIVEFVSEEPREANTAGGILPALFGTALMVFLMTFAVAPFGVLAAVFLHEYAKDGPIVRFVRIAVSNLAGVPSIVFGVFGLGFFVYLVGGAVDRAFFADRLPEPTFGTGGILWASLTLALLTLPVVVVAAEEGLQAVPKTLREASLALGATKAETVVKVVLPGALPGILTGVILAIARAAGEVAPLMIVGMVKHSPDLPLDAQFPYLHLERKFMHLGFHVFDLGFQSPNVEETKPLVYATALVLVLLVAGLNLAAIGLRAHLWRRHAARSA